MNSTGSPSSNPIATLQHALGVVIGMGRQSAPAAGSSPADLRLGKAQRWVLNHLNQSSYPHGGWDWGWAYRTIAVLDVLCERGLAQKLGSSYTITTLGRAILKGKPVRKSTVEKARRRKAAARARAKAEAFMHNAPARTRSVHSEAFDQMGSIA